MLRVTSRKRSPWAAFFLPGDALFLIRSHTSLRAWLACLNESALGAGMARLRAPGLPSANMPEQPALMERLRDLMAARNSNDAVGAVLRTIWDGNAHRDLQS